MSSLKRIGLGGGCHWCTEGVFVSLRGVVRVEQGWIASESPYDALSEAVIVHYDESEIRAVQLILAHLETHAATSDHALRGKYRSAVYYFNAEDAAHYRELLREVAEHTELSLRTLVLPFVAFRPSLPEHRDYFRSDPERPFCRRYIQPKLARLHDKRPELFSG
ncbi:peptide-methionine (S)-S-oxide reductase [Lewinella aquimaris]|uniref:peptide-methionine (S)-S-oxide reductase n=1 Tax=Neolewinella aquimaris TaxID=1835722 RepID=A0A840E3J1_9BACT|nr:peptide-methionine (S)-S-oxide reductase [Neolewinella aquimaris]MBB4080144.1 peptide-methionine (S)-S-oxide reductase [Neolewinella aquimaris]